MITQLLVLVGVLAVLLGVLAWGPRRGRPDGAKNEP